MVIHTFHNSIKPLLIWNEEYDGLDANIAAELVIRSKSTHLAPALNHGSGLQYIAPINYVVPQYGQGTPHGQPPQNMPPQQTPAIGPNPNLANLITSMDGPALQKLLGAMAQNPQTPQSAPNIQAQQQVPDLATLLVNVNRQQQQQQQQHQQQQQQQLHHHLHHHQPPHHQQGYPYPPQQQLHHQNPNPYPPHAPNPSFPNNGLLGSGVNHRPPPPHQNMMNQQHPHQHPQQQQAIQPGHVQNIMEQLARWKQ